MRRKAASILIVLLVVAALAATLSGQGAMSADEKAIRDHIARYDGGDRNNLFTSDRVFWSGAYRRPTIGSERSEESKTISVSLAARVSNSERGRTTPVRIVVAKSGDLAYEFSNGELSFETKDGKKVVIPQAILRTWEKDGGQWKIAAHFTRPIE